MTAPLARSVCKPRFCFGLRLDLAAALVCAVFFCCGCAAWQAPAAREAGHAASPSFVAALQLRAREIRNWDLAGEVRVRHQRRSWRIKLNWRQRGERFQLRVSNMTGATMMVINGEAGGTVRAMDARGTRYRGETPARLVGELLGAELPVVHLRSWILGAPSPRIAHRHARRADGKLLSFEQDGWRVRYRHRPNSTAPQRIEISSGDTHAALIVRSWKPRTQPRVL